jgi:hypothetical protein
LEIKKIFYNKLKFLLLNYEFKIHKAVLIFFREWKMIVLTLDVSQIEVCQLIAFGNLLLIFGQRLNFIYHILLKDLNFKKIHCKITI